MACQPARRARFTRAVAAAGVLVLAAALFRRSDSVEAQDVKAQAVAVVDQVIAAHGGMEAWTALRDMTFTITSVALTPQGDVAGARVGLYYLVQTEAGQGDSKGARLGQSADDSAAPAVTPAE